MPTGSSERDPLGCARQGALVVCRKLREVFSNTASNSTAMETLRRTLENTYTFSDVLESITARARQAPSLVATWGAAATLVFYASKAVDIEDTRVLEYILLDVAGPPPTQGRDRERSLRGASTALGYTFYMKAFLEAHSCLQGAAPGQAGGSVEAVLDSLIRSYMGSGARSQSQAINLVENLARFTMLYLEPLLSDVDDFIREIRGLEKSQQEQLAKQRLPSLVEKHCAIDTPSQS